MIKAVGLRSREAHIVRRLSSPPMRSDPRNHCIREFISIHSVNGPLLYTLNSNSPLLHSGARYNLGTRSGFDPARHGGVVLRAHAGYSVLSPALSARITVVCLGKATPPVLREACS